MGEDKKADPGEAEELARKSAATPYNKGDWEDLESGLNEPSTHKDPDPLGDWEDQLYLELGIPPH